MPRSKAKPSAHADSAPTSGPSSGASGAAAANEIRVGPAGWSYPDWSGYVYPSPRPKGFHPATYLAQFFDTIEINTSFYAPLRPERAPQWLDRVSPTRRFLCTAKLWQRFTHDAFSWGSGSPESGSLESGPMESGSTKPSPQGRGSSPGGPLQKRLAPVA